MVVSKTFSYVYEGDLLSVVVIFDFYAEDNQVGLSKTETVKKYDDFGTREFHKRKDERLAHV